MRVPGSGPSAQCRGTGRPCRCTGAAAGAAAAALLCQRPREPRLFVPHQSQGDGLRPRRDTVHQGPGALQHLGSSLPCRCGASEANRHGVIAWGLATKKFGLLSPVPLHRCLARPAAGMLYAKYYSGAAEDFALQCLTGADGSSRSEHYRRQVSRWHGLSSNANPAEELAFSASSCPCGKWLCHSPLGTGEVGKGEASPRQGAGRRLGGGLALRGLFLSRVKYSSAWGDELLGRGR